MGIRKLKKDYDLGFTHIIKSTEKSFRRVGVGIKDDINYDNYRNEIDVFYTPNTFNSPVKRSRENLWQLHRLYIDIDHKTGTSYIDYHDIVYRIEKMVSDNKLPRPSQYVNSGRGMHIYWDIYNCHVMLLDLWEKIESYLYDTMKSLEQEINNIKIDKRVTSPTAVLRLTGTINSRNREMCYSMLDNDTIHDIFDLKKKYIIANRKAKREGNLSYLPTKNIYTLNQTRLMDLEMIVDLRGGDVEGYRNSLILFYSYHYRLNNDITVKELINITKKFNRSFIKPYSSKELIYVCRSVNKTVKHFRKDSNKGYKFSNKYIIEALNITKEEEEKLLTIISTEEKYRRKNEKRYKARRDTNGLTKRQRSKEEVISHVKQLKQQGLNQKQVAKKLNKSISTVKRCWSV